jgi:N-carbamoylputrescine amidase
MRTEPFTVGIIQDAATDDRQATVDATVPRIREAAARGAQIVCLKELFNAPYFCKSQQCDRFDIAEAIPGPTIASIRSVTSPSKRVASAFGTLVMQTLAS